VTQTHEPPENPVRFIAPGERLVHQERLVEVEGVISPSSVSVRDSVTGKLREVPIGELNPLNPENPTDLTQISETHWIRAKARATELLPFVARGRIPQAARRRIAVRLGITERQVQRMFRRFRNDPRIGTLVPERPGPRPGSRRLTIAQEQAIAETIETHYNTETPKAIPDLLDYLAMLCQERQCAVPSESSVRRRINALEAARTLERREHRPAVRQKHEARTGRLNVAEALEWVQVDHTMVDVMVVSDDRFRASLGRPWLTLAVDIATRCLLGFYLSLDSPSATSVGACMAQVMVPKDIWLQRIGLDDVEWPMYGTPKVLHTDNAKELDSVALRRGCENNLIQIRHRPPGTPHYGGHIERVVGTFMRRVHAIPGTTFSNPRQRDKYESEAKAVMSLLDVRDWLTYEIMRYHSTMHKGIGQTPRNAWISALTRQGRYCPPQIPTAGDALLLQFLPCEMRKVRREGVEFDTLPYVPDEEVDLSQYVGREELIPIYFDPRDISYIYFRADDDRWITLHPNVPNFRPISRTEFRYLRKLKRLAANDPNDVGRRIAAIRGESRVLGKSRKETLAAHRRTQREGSRLDLAVLSNLPRSCRPMEPGRDLDFDPADIPIPKVEQWED